MIEFHVKRAGKAKRSLHFFAKNRCRSRVNALQVVCEMELNNPEVTFLNKGSLGYLALVHTGASLTCNLKVFKNKSSVIFALKMQQAKIINDNKKTTTTLKCSSQIEAGGWIFWTDVLHQSCVIMATA